MSATSLYNFNYTDIGDGWYGAMPIPDRNLNPPAEGAHFEEFHLFWHKTTDQFRAVFIGKDGNTILAEDVIDFLGLVGFENHIDEDGDTLLNLTHAQACGILVTAIALTCNPETPKEALPLFFQRGSQAGNHGNSSRPELFL